MSLPEKAIKVIYSNSDKLFEQKMKADKKLLAEKRAELNIENEKLFSIEEKWIANTITQDTFYRWFSKISSTKLSLQAAIERLNGDQNGIYKIVRRNLEFLSDLKSVYQKAVPIEKQELIRIGFDNNLYYKEGMYRTPTMIEILSHNSNKMRELGLLDYQKNGGLYANPPFSGPDET